MIQFDQDNRRSFADNRPHEAPARCPCCNANHDVAECACVPCQFCGTMVKPEIGCLCSDAIDFDVLQESDISDKALLAEVVRRKLVVPECAARGGA
jgi:hypothetical protein